MKSTTTTTTTKKPIFFTSGVKFVKNKQKTKNKKNNNEKNSKKIPKNTIHNCTRDIPTQVRFSGVEPATPPPLSQGWTCSKRSVRTPPSCRLILYIDFHSGVSFKVWAHTGGGAVQVELPAGGRWNGGHQPCAFRADP